MSEKKDKRARRVLQEKKKMCKTTQPENLKTKKKTTFTTLM